MRPTTVNTPTTAPVLFQNEVDPEESELGEEGVDVDVTTTVNTLPPEVVSTGEVVAVTGTTNVEVDWEGVEVVVEAVVPMEVTDELEPLEAEEVAVVGEEEELGEADVTGLVVGAAADVVGAAEVVAGPAARVETEVERSEVTWDIFQSQRSDWYDENAKCSAPRWTSVWCGRTDAFKSWRV